MGNDSVVKVKQNIHKYTTIMQLINSKRHKGQTGLHELVKFAISKYRQILIVCKYLRYKSLLKCRNWWIRKIEMKQIFQTSKPQNYDAVTFHIEYRGTTVAYPEFLHRNGERTEESGKCAFFCCCKYPILRILTHFFHKPHCLSW